MRLTLASTLVSAVSFFGACSFIYDSDEFLSVDAAPDINPDELEIDSIEPSAVFEGQGANAMARAVPIIVHGTNIAQGATIRIQGAGIDIETTADVNVAGTMAATSIRVPVDTELAAGATAMVTVSILQAATVEDSTTLTVNGLDEYVAQAGTVSSTDLAARYSQIELGAPISLLGSEPIRFVATDSIVVSGLVDASGRVDGQRSAGGFLGGIAGQDGNGTSGGARGQNQSGGGGAGNLMVGQPGQGDDAGSAGPATTATRLFPLSTAVGHGGGGGGVPIVGTGGAGGSGGGAIELRAGGTVVIMSTAELSADGATGENTSACATSGGAGGGGSGGALLIRSETGITIEGGAVLTVDGGDGGTATGNCAGGAGSIGQIRGDSPTISGSLGTTVRGPAWEISSVPAVVTSATLEATIVGEIGATYHVEVNGSAAQAVTLSNETENVEVTLQAGMNSLCALVDASGNPGQPESLTCVAVALIP